MSLVECPCPIIDSHTHLPMCLCSYQVWELEWLDHTRRLQEKLSHRPAYTIPVFEKTNIHGQGARSTISIPTEVLKSASGLELDMSLTCTGVFDRDCPPWDHVANLFVCCNNDVNHSSHDHMNGFGCASPCPSYAMSPTEHCGDELGRWITPFRRRIGHWITDVSSLAPLLFSPQCHFQMRTAAWAQPWLASLQLRILQSHHHKQERVPSRLIPLFRGGTFDSSYNKNRTVAFHLSFRVSKVELVAVITGHGSDNNNCGEFCVTSHRFVVNGALDSAIVDVFKDAGTEEGCANLVQEGVEPNEHGTWLYGRGGWYDGQEVDPWRMSITEKVQNGRNTIS